MSSDKQASAHAVQLCAQEKQRSMHSTSELLMPRRREDEPASIPEHSWVTPP
jgi:hypothetical protein